MQILAAIDSFFEGCQKILPNIRSQAPDIVSTFPYVNLEYSILQPNMKGFTKLRKALEVENIYLERQP